MKKIYTILFSLLIVSTSCNIYRYEEHQSRTAQPGMSGIITSTTADLKVSDTRISHTEVYTHDKHEDDINVDKAKEYTLAAALIEYNADVLVGPLFDVTTNAQNDKVSVTVTGYPATYINFRKTTAEDSLLLVSTNNLTKGNLFVTKKTDRVTSSMEVKRGWQNSISAVFGAVDFANLQVGLEYSGGWRFNKWFFLGFGTGYNFKLSDGHYTPLYAQFKVYFWGNKRVNLVLGIDQGVAAAIELNGDYYAFGSHTRGEIGANFRFDPKTSMFVSFTVGTSPYIWKYNSNYSPYYGYTDAYYNGGNYQSTRYNYDHGLYLGCKLGITF